MMFAKNKKEIVVCIGFVFAILLMRLWNISDLAAPFVFDDEVGYWSHAANLAGLSWTETESSWYSYGYSLLLVPLFWITHNMSYLYRMAIIINALMGVSYFFTCKYVIQEVDENCGNMKAMMISFTVSTYSAYVFQANVAWSETFIYAWFMIVVWMMLRFCKCPTWKYCILLSTEIGFLYVIHNRCIVILIAYILTLLYMVIKNKIDIKKFIVTILIFASIFFMNDLIKVHISELMWNIGDGFSGNDIASQGSKLKMLIDLEGWKILLQSFAGKLWYIFSSTLMVAYMGMAYIAKKVVLCVRRLEKDLFNNIDFFYIFLFLTVCGTITLASIATTAEQVPKTGRVRLDIFFYGRYSDMISGILILFGLLNFFSDLKKRNILEPVIGLCFYLACSIVLYYQIIDISEFSINTLCAPGIYFFKNFSVIQIFILVLGVYFAMYILCVLISLHTRSKKIFVETVCCCIFISLFIGVSVHAYQCCIKINQMAHSSSSDICEVLNKNVIYPVYNIVQKNFYKQGIRTRAVESEIKYELPSELKENCFIIVEGEKIKRFAEDLYFITTDRNVCLLGVGNKLAEDLQNKGFVCEKLEKEEYDSYDMCDVELYLEKGIRDIEITQKENLLIEVIIKSKKSGIILNNDRGYKLSYHIYKDNGEEILKNGERYDFGSFVNKEMLTVDIGPEEFDGVGDYIVEFDLVEEGVAWMSDLKGKTAKIQVSVIDDSIRFTYDMEKDKFVKTGFHPTENGFAWTSSEIAEIRCYLDKQDYYVRLQQSVGIPLGDLKINNYPIEIYLNKSYVTTIIINSENNGNELNFKIPEEKINQGKNTITFKSMLWSPKDYGAKDERKLGFAFHKMIFEEENSQIIEGKLDEEEIN